MMSVTSKTVVKLKKAKHCLFLFKWTSNKLLNETPDVFLLILFAFCFAVVFCLIVFNCAVMCIG